MRLTAEQVEGIIAGLSPFIKECSAELRLYGSRVRDELRGGDIDLLLLTEQEEAAESWRIDKHYLLASIEKFLGERKIDLTIATKKSLEQDSFLKMIFPDSVLLYQWHDKGGKNLPL